jgi:hypothetical protein
MSDDSQGTQTWIDRIATPFDRAWRADVREGGIGQRPRIEDCLAGVPSIRRPLLLEELMRIELEWRREAGEAPTAEEYRSRFPGHAGTIERLFAEAAPAPPQPTVVDGGRMPGDDPTPVVGPADGIVFIGPVRQEQSPRSVRVDGIPTTANPPDAGVSYFLGSRTPAAAGLSTTSPPQSGSLPSLDHEWGIERYARIRKLGDGGFGVVYLAKDRELGREVAIKLPKRPRPTSEQDALDFLSEARNLARLDHPGIVPVYDAGRAPDGRCYVVSKYIRGEDLSRRLKGRGRLKPEEAAELVRQVALALHHAHAHGLVHRDIKPANILLSRAGARGLEVDRAYVADFGLALKAEDVRLAGQFAGTPPYMSPEQITGDVPRLDGRSDIFSLGVVFYELLVGQRPFPDKSLADLRAAICSGTPKAPDQWPWGVPTMLGAICMKCLAKRPADRFQSAKQLADALHQWLTLEVRGPAADRAWRANVREGGVGQRPRIEDCLAGLHGLRRAVLLEELIRIELEWRRKAGEAPTSGEYRSRFPGHAGTIERLFAEAGPAPPRRPVLDGPRIRGGHPFPVTGSADAILFGGPATSEQQGRSVLVNQFGCCLWRAGYDAGWGADDAVECFTLFFLPLIPLKSVHIWEEKEGGTTREAVIPIRESDALVGRVMRRGWSRAFLACGLFFGFAAALYYTIAHPPPSDPHFARFFRWVSFYWFVTISPVALWVLGALWSSRRADRPCKIRILLGPHALGTSDPETWLDDTVAQAVPGLKIWLGAESFAEAAERLLESEDFRHAMWAARMSTACEDRRRGEQITDRILKHPRVSEALEEFRPTASLWERPL